MSKKVQVFLAGESLMESNKRTRLLRVGLAALGLILTPVQAQVLAQGQVKPPAQAPAPAQAQAPVQTAAQAPAPAPAPAKPSVPTEILPLAGTSPTDIIVGHVSGYTGPVASDAIEIGQGAEVYY